MQFYMVVHYYYDGAGRHDLDYVKPCSTKELAREFITTVVRDYDDYDFTESANEFPNALHHGPGQYAYDYYYVEVMNMDEEI